MSEFHNHLKTHMGFLQRSCTAYDEGNREEALRMAVSLRVLFHDTKSSTSLLSHLGVKATTRLKSTFVSQKSVETDFPGFKCHAVLPVMLTSAGVKPPTDTWEVRSVCLADDWWNEGVWLEGAIALSRRDIVLSAANQDGGAHVDENPSAKTRMVKAGPRITVTINGKPLESGMANHHYPLIRQMTFEVTTSPDMRRLIGDA
jgi:hypothetical protein